MLMFEVTTGTRHLTVEAADHDRAAEEALRQIMAEGRGVRGPAGKYMQTVAVTPCQEQSKVHETAHVMARIADPAEFKALCHLWIG